MLDLLPHLDWLSWLPSVGTLLHLAPLIMGGGTAVSGVLGLASRFVPWLRTAFLAAPWVLLLIAVAVLFLFKSEYANCQRQQAEAEEKWQLAVNEAQIKADTSSDKIALEEKAKDQERAETKYVFIDRIVNDPTPVPADCKPSGGARASSHYLRDVTSTRPPGGPKAQPAPAARMP